MMERSPRERDANPGSREDDELFGDEMMYFLLGDS